MDEALVKTWDSGYFLQAAAAGDVAGVAAAIRQGISVESLPQEAKTTELLVAALGGHRAADDTTTGASTAL